MEDQRQPTLWQGLPSSDGTAEGLELGFATRLRQLREQLGISQSHVAERMRAEHGFNWRQTTVAKAEAGTRPLALSEATAWASVLGVTLNEILTPAAGLIIELAGARKQLAEAETAARTVSYSAAKARKRVDILEMRLNSMTSDRSALLVELLEASVTAERLSTIKKSIEAELATALDQAADDDKTRTIKATLAEINDRGMDAAVRMAEIGHRLRSTEALRHDPGSADTKGAREKAGRQVNRSLRASVRADIERADAIIEALQLNSEAGSDDDPVLAELAERQQMHWRQVDRELRLIRDDLTKLLVRFDEQHPYSREDRLTFHRQLEDVRRQLCDIEIRMTPSD